MSGYIKYSYYATSNKTYKHIKLKLFRASWATRVCLALSLSASLSLYSLIGRSLFQKPKDFLYFFYDENVGSLLSEIFWPKQIINFLSLSLIDAVKSNNKTVGLKDRNVKTQSVSKNVFANVASVVVE
jgi:hypothetical protein